MNAEGNLAAEEIEWIASYASEVAETFGVAFGCAEARLAGSMRLLQRFTDASERVLQNGLRDLSSINEAHNELCVANALLVDSGLRFSTVEYEPVLPGCSKSIDFRATTDEGRRFFVDVKAIQPKPTDRWDQFERAVREGWFPENVRVLLCEEGLGGELWHNMFAARGRMLEYVLELEAKIRDCEIANENTIFILAFCGTGFEWRRDGLEDFVSFYRNRSHRMDDPFSNAEARYIEKNKITLDGTIRSFACLVRPTFNIRQRGLNWNVLPPGPSVFGCS